MANVMAGVDIPLLLFIGFVILMVLTFIGGGGDLGTLAWEIEGRAPARATARATQGPL